MTDKHTKHDVSYGNEWRSSCPYHALLQAWAAAQLSSCNYVVDVRCLWLAQMLASACSKVVASTATYPHEVIRSHMHIHGLASFSGFANVCRNVSFGRPYSLKALCGHMVIWQVTHLASISLADTRHSNSPLFFKSDMVVWVVGDAGGWHPWLLPGLHHQSAAHYSSGCPHIHQL